MVKNEKNVCPYRRKVMLLIAEVTYVIIAEYLRAI